MVALAALYTLDIVTRREAVSLPGTIDGAEMRECSWGWAGLGTVHFEREIGPFPRSATLRFLKLRSASAQM